MGTDTGDRNRAGVMSRVMALRVTNMILFFSFVLQAITGVIMFLKIRVPNREVIFEIHEYNGILMIIVIFVHIAFNWGWVKANFFKKDKIS